MADEKLSEEKLTQQVAELLKSRCAECHTGAKAKGDLRLTTWEELARGNKRGPIVFPGKIGESLLWEVVDDDRMPPDDPLSTEERGLLKSWIEQGAPGLPAVRNAHWAFQPVGPAQIPAAVPGIPARNAIDRYLAKELSEHKLTFRPEADRLTLIRRLSFDLTGLPPTLDEIDAFLADESPQAYGALVERYLASPRYGERWGKYWLDVAGYADSNGYFNADSVRPLAYRYRDYVVTAFNRDKPYDQFVREQLAGDELAKYVAGGDVTPEMVEPLIATHFLRNAPDGTGESDGNDNEQTIDKLSVIEGNLQITVNSLLGLTIQCAKCHSHKFEPISHEEYYRLQAILFPAYLPTKWVKPNDRAIAVGTSSEREAHRHKTEQVDRQLAGYRKSLERISAPLREEVVDSRLQNLSAEVRGAVLEALRQATDKRNDDQKALIVNHVEPLKITDDDLVAAFPEYKSVRDEINAAITITEARRPEPLMTLAALTEVNPQPPAHHILLRGQHTSPGPEVAPGVLSAVTTAHNPYQIEAQGEAATSSGRRLAFARWITSPENPLFARVMANRIWQFHFGTGLVTTPDNFGQSGARPTHPELLDYLAHEFVKQGWSVKAMHRLIVSSSAYRQESRSDPTAAAVDPQNRLWWHFPVLRLDAEAVRDATLAVAGDLDLRTGGPFVPTQRAGDGTVTVDQTVDGALRRSIYLQQRRTQVLTLLELFDAPTIVTNCSFRNPSTVPLQSLALLNSDFIRQRSVSLERRVTAAAGETTGPFVMYAFRLTCGRPPTESEIGASQRFIEAQSAEYGSAADAQLRARQDFCQMLLASNAFLYIE